MQIPCSCTKLYQSIAAHVKLINLCKDLSCDSVDVRKELEKLEFLLPGFSYIDVEKSGDDKIVLECTLFNSAFSIILFPEFIEGFVMYIVWKNDVSDSDKIELHDRIIEEFEMALHLNVNE